MQALYPPSCRLCGLPVAGSHGLCPACEQGLPWNRHACTGCAAPLPDGDTSPTCGRCLRHPPHWQAAASPLHYAWPVDQLIQRFKFHADLVTGRLLGELLARYLAAGTTPRPACIVPVPLHPTRLKERGYNQALELARPVSRRLDIPLATNLCRRVRATAVQSRLDARARQRNLRGAFAVTGAVAGLHIALLDDVVTTGATLSALATALRDAGAKRITVWGLAHAGG